MKCPLCQLTDYKSEAWFVKHMKTDHNIEEWQATQVFRGNLEVCPECQITVPITNACIRCGYLFPQISATKNVTEVNR